jgi:hypothetical protein
MRAAQSGLRAILVGLAFSCPCASAVIAGGGFAEQYYVQQGKSETFSFAPGKQTALASDTITITAQGDGYNVIMTAGATAAAGNIASAVGVWNTTTAQTIGDVAVTSSSATNTFSKAGRSISKGVTSTEATVTVNGQVYAVAQELAFALARSTEYGSTAAVQVEGMLATPVNSYSSAPVASAKGAAR